MARRQPPHPMELRDPERAALAKLGQCPRDGLAVFDYQEARALAGYIIRVCQSHQALETSRSTPTPRAPRKKST